MKNLTKLTLTFSFLLLLKGNLFSQEIVECGTMETPESLEFYQNNKQQIMQFEEAYLNTEGARLSLTPIPIKAHVIRTSSGTGGLTISQLNNAINSMNVFYANANMKFYLCDGINYIDNSTYYNFVQSDEYALTSSHGVSGLINIYFANKVTSSGGDSLCGYAYYPGGPNTIVMENSCTINGSTLSHEMGHFYSLRHTHGETSNELVDGSNCLTAGDFLCDTAADPTLSYSNVNRSCVYVGTNKDVNGATYVPDPANIMSYSRKECRTIFTAQQYARIYATSQTTRNNLNCSSFRVAFVADITQSCENYLTVNFTDGSSGATSWEWDVDGDNVIDYTTQNPSHTYNASGFYDVSLTIYNETSSITKSMSEYIQVGIIENIPLVRDFNEFSNLEADGWRATTALNSIFVWALNSGNTPIYSTGPAGDSSPAGDGLYIYTKAFGSNPGDVAEYTSPCIEINFFDATLTFAYHMFGNGMGELHVDIDSGSGFVNDAMPAIIGQQQTSNADAYLEKQIDLSPYAGETIKIRFRAIRGNNYNSDIAIDNININGALSVNNLSEESIHIYPNPVNKNVLHVKLKNSENNIFYKILNILGQEIMNGSLETETIDVSNLKAGTYFLTLSSNENLLTKKFIKL